MSLAVVDASVLVAFYAADDPRRPQTTTRLRAGHALFAPAHLDAEVVAALRGMAKAKPTLIKAIPTALKHLAGFPIRRMPLAPLLDRIWHLRENITPYDAAYVALAEHLNGVLITCDAKLAAASGPRCAFDLITKAPSGDGAAAGTPRKRDTHRGGPQQRQADLPDEGPPTPGQG